MKELSAILAEDTPLKPVSESSKQGWWFLASVMIGCTICAPVFFMGAEMSQKIAYNQFVLAALLGGVFSTLISIATGIVGQKTGLPTATLVKMTFGNKGSILANLAMLITCVGWFGIQTSVFGGSFVKLAQQVWGIDFNATLVMAISGLIMSSTAIIGFRGLGKLSYVATPLLILLLLMPLFVLYSEGSLSGVGGYVPENVALTFGTVVAMVAGAYSASCTMPDLTRFMKSTRALVGGTIANYTLAYPLLLILTGATAVAAGENDYMQIMLNMGYGTLAIIVLFLATWTTNDTNVYSGALSVNLFAPKWERWKLAAIVGVLGTLMAILGIFEHFMSWLIFAGNLFAPMAGVYVADFWLNRDRYRDLDNIPSFRYQQIAAWMGGLLLGLCTTGKDSMGFALFSVTTAPMLDALLTAAALQLFFHKVCRK